MLVCVRHEEPIEDRAKGSVVGEVHTKTVPHSRTIAVHKLEKVVPIYLGGQCSRVDLTGLLCVGNVVFETIGGSDEEADDGTVGRGDANDSDPLVALGDLAREFGDRFVETTNPRLARFVWMNVHVYGRKGLSGRTARNPVHAHRP